MEDTNQWHSLVAAALVGVLHVPVIVALILEHVVETDDKQSGTGSSK